MVPFICCFWVQIWKFSQRTVLTSRSHGFWVFTTRAGHWANWLAVRTNYFVLLVWQCRGTFFLIKKFSSKFLPGWKQVAHYKAKHFEELFKVALSTSLHSDPKFYAEDEVLYIWGESLIGSCREWKTNSRHCTELLVVTSSSVQKLWLLSWTSFMYGRVGCTCLRRL